LTFSRLRRDRGRILGGGDSCVYKGGGGTSRLRKLGLKGVNREAVTLCLRMLECNELSPRSTILPVFMSKVTFSIQAGSGGAAGPHGQTEAGEDAATFSSSYAARRRGRRCFRRWDVREQQCDSNLMVRKLPGGELLHYPPIMVPDCWAERASERGGRILAQFCGIYH